MVGSEPGGLDGGALALLAGQQVEHGATEQQRVGGLGREGGDGALAQPPLGPLRMRRWMRGAWFVEGGAQWLSGQTRHVRPAVARRLREGGAPAFPPKPADALLLGGTVFDLLAREEGERAAVEAARLGADHLLADGFHGRGVRRTEDAWRSHLTRIADAGAAPTRRRS